MKNLSLGKTFAVLARLFIGALSKRLEGLDIDRYYIILILLDNSKEELTQQKICEELQIDKVMMVKMIDYLSLHEYVERRRNPEDRREQLIYLTSKARRILPRIKEAYSSITTAAFKGIKENDIIVFHNCINAIHANLSKVASNEVVLTIKRQKQKKSSNKFPQK